MNPEYEQYFAERLASEQPLVEEPSFARVRLAVARGIAQAGLPGEVGLRPDAALALVVTLRELVVASQASG